MAGGSFTVKNDVVERITKKVIAYSNIVDNALMKKMQAAVTIIYQTARARRPKISAQMHKAAGGKKGGYRVSDPAATLGVPVDTGALQLSIKKSVTQKGGKTTGTVSAGGGAVGYATMIEFGTSKMAARPFMRPAINENADEVKRIFLQKITKL